MQWFKWKNCCHIVYTLCRYLFSCIITVLIKTNNKMAGTSLEGIKMELEEDQITIKEDSVQFI